MDDDGTFDLLIITGRGNHRNSAGGRGVMRGELVKYLGDEYPALHLRHMPGNEGCVLVTHEALWDWLRLRS